MELGRWRGLLYWGLVAKPKLAVEFSYSNSPKKLSD